MEELLPEIRDSLTQAEREYLQSVLKERIEKGTSPTNDALVSSVYNYLPVDIIEFIESSEYLNLGKKIYPRVKEVLWYADMDDVREVCVEAGKASGKSVIASIMALRSIYKIKAFRSPQSYYDLLPNTTIFAITVSVSFDQALEGVFHETKGILENSGFFKNKMVPVEKVGMIRFGGNIAMLCGHSMSTKFLGFSVHTAVMDEANLHKRTRTSKADYGEELHDNLLGSLQTRFPLDYKLVSISSANSENDFLTRYMDKLITQSIDVKAFDFRKNKSVRQPINLDDPRLLEPLIRGDKDGKKPIDYFNECIHGLWKTDIELLVRAPTWELSEKTNFNFYIPRYKRNPSKSHKDFGNVVSRALEFYFKTKDVVKLFANPDRVSPMDGNGRFHEWFHGDRRFHYVVHFDLSNKHDNTGWSLSHLDRYHDDIVVIDWMHSYKIPEGSDLDYQQVESMVAGLVQRGFNIRLLTSDGFQSFEFRQNMNKMGIDTQWLSVDANLGPYDTYQELLLTGHLDYYYNEIMNKETNGLVLLDGRKVDHDPKDPTSSKDMMDAVAANCFVLKGGVASFQKIIRPMPSAVVSSTYRPGVGLGGVVTFEQGTSSSKNQKSSNQSSAFQVRKMPRAVIS